MIKPIEFGSLLLLYSVLSGGPASAITRQHITRNVVFVMTDGLRWQEVFGGADDALMNKENGGVEDVAALKAAYGRDTIQERRRALMPFLWSMIAENGQIYGNRNAGSQAYVTNGFNFSYPGYSETLCGFPDSRIHSNNRIPNPNISVLEWLNRKTEYHGKVAAFGAWNTFDAIFNTARAGFPVNAGYDPLTLPVSSPELELLNHFKADGPRIWKDEPFDAVPFYTSLEYLKLCKPRVLYLSLGETDEWAHAGDYKRYLDSSHRVDEYLRALWNQLQSMPEYRGSTTLIFSPDHGRGMAPSDWKSHGEKLPESKYIWMAFLGPDTPSLGERRNIADVKQNQIAATIASLLGEDYNADVPNAGLPVADVFSKEQVLRPEIHLLKAAAQHARAHGATYSPILSPGDELLRGASPIIDLAAVREAGFAVVPWTVDDPARMTELIDQGVDGAISDRPDLLVAALASSKRAHLNFDVEGHRGARDLRPENTLPAFEVGLDHFISTIETDTGVTSDRVSLISHEQFINPQTCRRADGSRYTVEDRVWIKDITMAQAQRTFVCDQTFRGSNQLNDLSLSPVAVAFSKSGRISHPYAPTYVQQLFEFVQFYADYYTTGPGRANPNAAKRARNASRVRFNLETKITPVPAALSPSDAKPEYGRTVGPEEFAETLNQVIARTHMEARCFVQSFDFRTLVLTQARYPRVQTVYLVESPEALTPTALPEALR